jgi:hypothetical protein
MIPTVAGVETDDLSRWCRMQRARGGDHVIRMIPTPIVIDDIT